MILNLEKFGVQELDAREVQSVEGGYFPAWVVALMGPPGSVMDICADYIQRKYDQGELVIKKYLTNLKIYYYEFIKIWYYRIIKT